MIDGIDGDAPTAYQKRIPASSDHDVRPRRSSTFHPRIILQNVGHLFFLYFFPSSSLGFRVCLLSCIKTICQRVQIMSKNQAIL